MPDEPQDVSYPEPTMDEIGEEPKEPTGRWLGNEEDTED